MINLFKGVEDYENIPFIQSFLAITLTVDFNATMKNILKDFDVIWKTAVKKESKKFRCQRSVEDSYALTSFCEQEGSQCNFDTIAHA